MSFIDLDTEARPALEVAGREVVLPLRLREEAIIVGIALSGLSFAPGQSFDDV